MADRSLGNYPNPFSQKTTLRFRASLWARQSVIHIYTLQGKLVRYIDVTAHQEGRYELSREELGEGIYFYSLFEDGILKASKRLIIGHE
ncbi:T9SS type A sorting domain-containing protein [Spirosoma aerophilum]